MERGIGTSRGIGIGHVLIVYNASAVVNRGTHYNAEEEKKRFFEARKTFIEQTEELLSELEKKLGESDKDALVLKNQIYLARDITTENEVVAAIDNSHICAEAAFDDVCNKLIQLFSSMDNPDMQQRVTDIQDMRERMIQILQGTKAFDLTNLPDNTVIVADEIKPSMTASMDIAHVAGIVAEKGGDTAHASILARALEIPAVLSVDGIVDQVSDGMMAVVDGCEGVCILEPAMDEIAEYETKRADYLKEKELLQIYRGKDTVTADGTKVALYGNIGNPEDAKGVVAADGEGVGLFRTEFLFMGTDSLPTEDEQFEAYKAAAETMQGKEVIIRTLDVGGDKDIPYLGLEKEDNPFLGFRAVRYCLKNEDSYKVQLRALLRASAFGDIKIMVPLVTCVDEIRRVKELVAELKKELDSEKIAYNKDIQVGVMIETPAASLIADLLAKEADFFSIGTNDLTQYTMAVDRGNAKVAYLYSAYNPAVLRSMKNVIEAGNAAGIMVGMCGEAAADPLLIPLLISFGLGEFSVSATSVLRTRGTIAKWSKADADALAAKALSLSTEAEVAELLKAFAR